MRSTRSSCPPWALFAALAPLVGCSYTSQYMPPQDGRARALWSEDRVVASLPPADPVCLDETAALAAGQPARVYVTGGRPVVYGGRRIVVWQPVTHVYVHGSVSGGGPIARPTTIIRNSPAPTAYSPARPSARPSAPTAYNPARPSVRPGAPAHATSRPAGHSSSSGGSGNGDGAAALAAAAAVIVILAMPAVTLSLALSEPGPGKENASATATVNAFNDLARTGGTPCSSLVAYEGEIAP